MLICPECASEIALAGAGCARCGWKLERRGGVPVLLSESDRNDPFFVEYLQNYDRIAADDLTKSIQDERYARAQAAKLRDYLGTLSGLRVCDVGVGRGLLFSHLAASDARSLTAVDISLAYLIQLPDRDRHRIVIANAENLPFVEEFDLLVASDVLEHVSNVGNFLVSVNRALPLGGRFVVRVPLEESLMAYSRWLGCPYKFVHLRAFTKRGLRLLLESAGFEVTRFRFDGFERSRARTLVTRYARIKRMFLEELDRRYSGRHEAEIPNVLGALLMRPIEIAAIATKRSSLAWSVPAAVR